MTTDLALQALLIAVWRRKPDGQITVYSDQGSQFTSKEWRSFRECPELCVSGLAHAGFRYGHALKRSSNMIAN